MLRAGRGRPTGYAAAQGVEEKDDDPRGEQLLRRRRAHHLRGGVIPRPDPQGAVEAQAEPRGGKDEAVAAALGGRRGVRAAPSQEDAGVGGHINEFRCCGWRRHSREAMRSTSRTATLLLRFLVRLYYKRRCLINFYYSYGGSEDGNNTGSTSSAWGPRFDGQEYYQYDPTVEGQSLERQPWTAYKDNRKDFWRTGVTFTNNLSLQGGNDKGSMRLSVGHSKNEWITLYQRIKLYF